MTTFVLVHGAWQGGWCWKRILPFLREAGHEVFAPTLTGLGERAHLAHPDIDLVAHVRDVVALLETEELGDIVLVGHSYGGMVITGVADHARERIRRLIYLDAFVPENGKCLLDYLHPERRALIEKGAAAGFVDPLPNRIFGVTDPVDIAWVQRHEVPHPFRCFAQPIVLKNGGGESLPRTFVYCSNPPTGSFDSFAARYRRDPAWRYHEMETGHDCMILQPADTARVLLENA